MIRKIVTSLKQFRRTYEDQKLGRQLVGTDPHGNLYYQYYDQNGKPTRRMSERTDKMAPFVDPLWEEWIRHIRDKPYTEEERMELEKQQRAYKTKVNEYEQKDAEMMQQFKKSNKTWNANKK
ncbi:unnamed protein product (macronuclear) [Paramecium tetraurelia]|uniref:NADH dehydrogenase [ubiquinone] 1 alpha subcomplex subunit 12 n=1 Tax=Paramecium tetraurelia TaxID=5888 RepID=A0DNQ3_PARTE|nr:uncharacterized protein GSPATT00018866001 [Paramecium tetraurelia]CAK84670.1 unnamed protein product [Paramecium tetraurelia]|eukprot:XP_001452067.1 hypothetical protein (macronuclear) [Paramecium tetraurelia strain d4-2]